MSLKNVCLITKIDTKLVSMGVKLLQNIIHPPVFRQLSYNTWQSLCFYGIVVRRQIYYNPFKCHPLNWADCDFCYVNTVYRDYDPLGYGLHNVGSSARSIFPYYNKIRQKTITANYMYPLSGVRKAFYGGVVHNGSPYIEYYSHRSFDCSREVNFVSYMTLCYSSAQRFVNILVDIG